MTKINEETKRKMHEALDQIIARINEQDDDYCLPDLEIELTRVNDPPTEEWIRTIGCEFVDMVDGSHEIEERYDNVRHYTLGSDEAPTKLIDSTHTEWQ